jgi:hypothetical protein
MADSGPRTVVSFRTSLFNTSEPRPYFINPCCFGDDAARWIMAALERAGMAVDPEPGQEDFGWYFGFRVEGVDHHLVIGNREDAAGATGEWIGWLERNVGFLQSLLGRRNTGISPAAARAIHAALHTSPDIQDVRWHWRRDFDAGREELGQPEP